MDAWTSSVAPNVPIVLVGTKLDLLEDRGYLAHHMGSNIITTAQWEELRKQIGATAYIECNSKSQQNVKAVLILLLRLCFNLLEERKWPRRKRPRSSGCSIV
ncbi:hypothetical protein Pfo_003657 [Paulownia fortunei]|nr:hypothetical protein Pfo_003657 [Paulownia fortunei]